MSLRLVEIRALAADLEAAVEDPTDEIAYTRAVLAIEAEVRRARVSVPAAVASSQAGETIVRAAQRDGAELPDGEVVRVGRAAAQIARGLVAGDAVRGDVELIARGFRRLQRVTAA